MSLKTYFHTLSEVLLFSNRYHHDLKKALTHASFYKNSEKAESSKYIFLGMYAFKGKVAEVMRKYVPLTGKQLQHYLGNVFKINQLNKIYEKYHLQRMVRYGNCFSIEKQQHLFVYALLGFVYQFAEEKYLLRFIYRNFLANTQHLMPGKTVNKDLKSKLLYLSQMHYNTAPVILENKTDTECSCQVYLDEKLVAKEKGKNPKTVRQCSLKTALKILTEKLEQEWKSDPFNVVLLQQRKKQEAEREAKEKAEKLKRYKAKQEKRSKEIAKNKQLRKAEAALKDEKRRKAKANAKKRREELEELQRKQKLAMATMSIAKRRHLQDKGLLEKGAPS